MKSSIWKISVSISEQAEEPIIAVFEKIFGKVPSIFTDENSRKTTASVFLTKSSQWNSSVKAELSDSLKMLRDAGIEIGSGRIHFQKLQREDWAESWKKHFKPIRVGRALLIKPSWSRLRPLKNQACVILDPGLSFGTGQHATTLFCLEELVRYRKNEMKQSFLDIGTGSGILAISAAKLGYSPVRAFDFDPESVRMSRINVEQNNVANSVHPIRRDLTKLPVESKTKFDVICANLMYDLLISERKRILNRLTPGGTLILAGILKTQFPQVQTAYEKSGMKLIKTKTGKEWQSGSFIAKG